MTADRTCAAVRSDYYSAEGDNKQHACFNSDCPDGTWRSGTGCDKATGEGYECKLCSGCGAGLFEATACSGTVDRTCQPVQPEHYSADGDVSQQPCFSHTCDDADTFRAGTCDNSTGAGYVCERCFDYFRQSGEYLIPDKYQNGEKQPFPDYWEEDLSYLSERQNQGCCRCCLS